MALCNLSGEVLAARRVDRSFRCRVCRDYRTFLTWGSQASAIRLVRLLQQRHLEYRELELELVYRELEYRLRVFSLGISQGRIRGVIDRGSTRGIFRVVVSGRLVRGSIGTEPYRWRF